MKSKITFILALAAMVFLAAGSVWAYNDYYVNASTGNDLDNGLAAVWDGTNGPKFTIQAAITAASPGDTISVAAGTYNERLSISKSIDLRGAQYGVDPIPPGARTTTADESIITRTDYANPDVLIEVRASDVKIDGFKLIGEPNVHENPGADRSVVRLYFLSSQVVIANNIMDGARGVLVKGDSNDVTISKNHMTVNKNGVVVQPSPASDVTISGNVFTLGSSPGGDETAIYMQNCSQSRVTGNTATGFVNAKGLVGVSVEHLTVSGNTFVGNKDAISIWGGSTFITISDNVLSYSVRYGISIKGQDVLITGNKIANNGDVGVNIARHVIDTERITISENIISDNTNYGVKFATTTVTEIINAVNNWWGDPSGPYDPDDIDGLNQLNLWGLGNGVTEYVLYDPWLGGAGFITGGGTIWSEAGYYKRDTSAFGQASFGFVSRYKKGANTPEGHANFVFYAGGLHFRSSEYDWLVVTGNNAKFKGVGTIDGASGTCKFMIWAGDDELDTFRIKIWEEVNGSEDIVYDNGSKQVITVGNIFIHKEKKK